MELTKTPLLLALLCLVYDDLRYFPARKVDLYKEAFDVWLKKWDSSRDIKRDEIYKNLPPVRREQMLSRIAASSFEKGAYFISRERLSIQIEEYINNLALGDNEPPPNGEEILRAIEAQHGILVERAYGIYSFSHSTFQEFLTARYIVAHAVNGTIENLANKYLFDRRWHEVFLMTVSLLDEADQLFSLAIKKARHHLSRSASSVEIMREISTESSNLGTTKPIIRACLLYIAIDNLYSRFASTIAEIGDEHINESFGKQGDYDPELLDDLSMRLASDARFDIILAIHGRIREIIHKLDKHEEYRIVDILEKYSIRYKFNKSLGFEINDLTILDGFLQASQLLLDCLPLASLSDRKSVEHIILNF